VISGTLVDEPTVGDGVAAFTANGACLLAASTADGTVTVAELTTPRR
jgi:hypothetical protein